MTDTVLYVADKKTRALLPLKAFDNGDGTYSLDIGSKDARIFTSTASSTTTLTCAALAAVAGEYVGQVVIPLAGAMSGEARYITAYNGTAIITVSPAWAVDPGAATAGILEFAIVSSALGYTAAEVQTSSVASGAGSVATLSRLGLLVRWIADALNSGTSGLAALLAAIVGVETTTKRRQAARLQTFQYHCTSAANAGDVVAATFTAQDCDIKALNVRSNGATTADLTSIAVFGGTGKVITFIAAVDGIRANIAAADQQVGWQTNGGVITLPATHTIVITLAGTGATAVDLTMTIEYVATTDGGYLA